MLLVQYHPSILLIQSTNSVHWVNSLRTLIQTDAVHPLSIIKMIIDAAINSLYRPWTSVSSWAFGSQAQSVASWDEASMLPHHLFMGAFMAAFILFMGLGVPRGAQCSAPGEVLFIDILWSNWGQLILEVWVSFSPSASQNHHLHQQQQQQQHQQQHHHLHLQHQ